jgi:hypothetical protein
LIPLFYKEKRQTSNIIGVCLQSDPYYIRVFLMSGIFLSHSESSVYQKGASFILIKKRCNNKKLKHKLLEQLFSL